MDQLLAAGDRVTNDIDSINAFTWDGVPAPKRSSGWVGG
jgi:hypothetical protein